MSSRSLRVYSLPLVLALAVAACSQPSPSPVVTPPVELEPSGTAPPAPAALPVAPVASVPVSLFEGVVSFGAEA